MKFVFLVFLFICLCYKSVYGVIVKSTDIGVKVDPIEYEAEDKFLKVGDVIRIHCRGTSKKQKVEWYYPNGEMVQRQPLNRVYVQEHPRASRLVKPADHVLTITNAMTIDTGVWECRSKDSVDSVELCVIDPAEFENTKNEEVVDEGRSLSLTCQAKGDPEPNLFWYKDDELITEETDGDKYTIGSKFNHRGLEGFLTIKSIQANDQGMYTCVAEQKNNLVEHCSHESIINITLNVNHAPRFEWGDDNAVHIIYAEKDEKINLNCEPSAYPPPRFRWFRELDSKGNGIFVEFSEKDFIVFGNSTGSRFSFKANSSVFGEKFVCKAENFYGKAAMKYFIKNIVAPSRPDSVFILNSTSDEIKFNITWYDDVMFPIARVEVQYFEKKASFTPRREVHWSGSEEVIIDESGLESVENVDDSAFYIKDLKEDTEYWMRLRVGNSAGLSSWTSPILVATTAQEDLQETLAIIDEGSLYKEIFFGLFWSAMILALGGGCIIVLKRL